MFLTTSITSTGMREEFFDGVSVIDSTSRWSPGNPEIRHNPNARPVWAVISAMLNMALDTQQTKRQVTLATPDVHGILANAYDVVYLTQNRLVAKRATLLLNELEQALRRLHVTALPPLHASELEDHSLLFEWVLPGRRAGITIDPLIAQSGWFLLADDAKGKCEAWGYLDSLDLSLWIRHIQEGTLPHSL